ncbi:IstB-like ATP binding protein [Paraburkholderia sp. BL18I3N2]|nr:IstB-like ATP binding protein [Paraburkholderia sp. BL18I3N2]
MPNYMAAQQDNERKRQPLTNLASLGIKTLAQYDFGFASGAPRAQIQELASLAFIERAANVVLLGLSGGGKTHLDSAIGHALIDAGYGSYSRAPVNSCRSYRWHARACCCRRYSRSSTVSIW